MLLDTPSPARRIAAAADARLVPVRAAAAEHRAPALPLRFWRQQVHFTTPASNAEVARKAVEGGYASALRVFQRFEIDANAIAEALDVDLGHVQRLIQRADTSAPLVIVDGEDAQAPREDVVAAGRASAASVFRQAAWPTRTLRFYRPNGLDTDWTAADLSEVLLAAGPGKVDGLVFPKSEHPEEMAWLDETLLRIEEALGVAARSIRVELLVESGWAVRNLERLVLAALPRLAGIILGIADYSSDVGLPVIFNSHPTADWVRMEIVNLAGAVGVPAIDTMTFDYPVADARLSAAENRARILSRLRRCFDDARHGIELGMAGKWAGHPAQVFAVLLAYEATLDHAEVEARVREVQAYVAATAEGRGTAMLDSNMIDRATDRHAREVLRKALLLGRIEPELARSLGVIGPED
jgi:citrate lyase beta subunit